ncbi:hypothetical protein ACFV9E_09075 [Streptomyces sp. NPDC059835]|uniref:hypothetical protein n=1 Tax=Streptomyces sp. NPDC059835 TaxID=3346967 RepID=UPI0036463EE8
MTTHFEARHLQIADAETARIADIPPGTRYIEYADLVELYGTSHRTIARACEELRQRGLIRRVSDYRAAGHVVTGGVAHRTAESPTDVPAVLASLQTGDGTTCPVCGGGRRGDAHPVWGWACSSCVRTGAVVTGLAASTA